MTLYRDITLIFWTWKQVQKIGINHPRLLDRLHTVMAWEIPYVLLLSKTYTYRDITGAFSNSKDSLTSNYYLDFNKKQKALLNQEYKIKDLIKTINNNLFNYRTYINQTKDKENHAHIYMIFYLPKDEKPDSIKICLKEKEIIGEVYKYPEICSLRVFKETDFIHGNKLYETEE